jgi:hypothetical protein
LQEFARAVGRQGRGVGPRLGGGEACEGAKDLTVAGPAARRGRGRGAHDLAGPVSGAVGVGTASEQCRVECVSFLFE